MLSYYKNYIYNNKIISNVELKINQLFIYKYKYSYKYISYIKIEIEK